MPRDTLDHIWDMENGNEHTFWAIALDVGYTEDEIVEWLES